MFSYIIHVTAFQLLFLMGYELLLKKETFFTYNRWYLLSTSVFALLLPLIKIEGLTFFVPEETISNLSSIWLPEVFIGEQQHFSETLPAVQIGTQDKQYNFWFIIYSMGFIGSLFLVSRKFQNLNRLFNFRIASEGIEYRIIEIPNSDIACTFYKTIFLGEHLSEAERSQILNHELVHVKQKHSLDLLFFEILKVVFWFNPLIYIYQNKIATVHEYLADEAVVKDTGKLNYYEQLLNSAFSTRNISFINQFFNHSLTHLTVFGKTIAFGSSGGQIKKRIVMLQRSKSKTIAKLKYLVILPLMLVMLTIVSCSQDNSEQVETSDSLSEQLDKLKLKIEESEEISAEDRDKMVSITTALLEKSENSNGTEGQHFRERFAQGADVPFAVIDQVPIFPGCENLGSNEVQKDCMSGKITEFVSSNFDVGLGKELGLTGKNRVIVQFKIDKNGKVAEVKARAPHPALEEEAKRVINSLPTMQPGKQNGEEVGVMYSLPIVFQVGE